MIQGFSKLRCSPLAYKLLLFWFLPILPPFPHDAKTDCPKSELRPSKARHRQNPYAKTVFDFTVSKTRSVRATDILQTFFTHSSSFPGALSESWRIYQQPCLQGWKIRRKGSTVSASPAHGVAAGCSPAVFHTLHPHGTAQS